MDPSHPHHQLMSPGGFVGNVLSTKEGQVQKELGCLGAAFHLINFTTPSTSDLDLEFQYGLYACVQQPYATITGNVNITYQDEKYTVTCENCNLTVCLNRTLKRTYCLSIKPLF